ncbi:hypothetical protein FIBSPDRAFT_943096 [Athelia psychrophila]|uniref:Uncharacterized protein n=1 Tax=Athelia psychrophila TaxID=1759441 RepID=A0A166WRA9_9AGAM|nr:hypothetical protein FIBSPDRAFT_943096 [Fibularhizoctonia sp. CBS 109695]
MSIAFVWLASGASALPISPIEDAGIFSYECSDISYCRTMFGIVWSCLATIFACTWVAVHPNVPAPKPKRWYHPARRRVAVTLCALLVPEYIVAWSIRQWLVASHIIRDIKQAEEEAHKEKQAAEREQQAKRSVKDSGVSVSRPDLNTQHHASEGMAPIPEAGKERDSEGNGIDTEVNKASHSEVKPRGFRLSFHLVTDALAKTFTRNEQEWTITHGFLVVMGGLYYYETPPYDNEAPPQPTHPVSREDLTKLIKMKKFTLPHKAEINDKSKGDPLSKTFAIIQTLWFVMQCGARRLQSLPITKLELVTLAYAAITVAMYWFWWSKPLNVLQPFRVTCTPPPPTPPPTPPPPTSRPPTVSSISTGRLDPGRLGPVKNLMYTVVGIQDDEVDLRGEEQVPAFYAGKPDHHLVLLADFIALLIALIFGAVHCIAWSFTFPSHVEQHLWRISSTAIVAVPFIFIILIGLLAFESKRFSKVAVVGAVLGIPCYIVARVVLLVLAFTTLRSLPLDAYQTVHWLTFLPHV